MSPAAHIGEKIADILQHSPGDLGTLSAVASDYADLCRKLNARLEQLREVLDAGDERQALLMAESYPPVIDEAMALCFPKLKQWQSLCQANEMPVAPEIRANVVQQLNVIYAKGISSSHAIYKEFRTAILERDDDRALTLARAIEKLNPGDANAKSERERLERKVFNTRIASLSEAQSSGAEAAILRTLTSVETLGLTDRESVSPEVLKAREVRRAVDAKMATEKVAAFSAQIAAAQSAGEWTRVREMISRVEALVTEHKLTLTPDQVNILSSGRGFFAVQQAAALKRMQFQDALKVLLTHSEIVESKIQAPGVVKSGELHALLADLNRNWQTVEAFTMEVDPKVLQRVSKQVEILRAEIVRLQKRRITVISASVFAVVVVVSLTGWYLLELSHAKEAAAQIRAEIANRHVAASERLVQVAEAQKLPMYSSSLVSAIEEAHAFQRESIESGKLAEQHLSQFETVVDKEDFPSGPADANARFEALEKELSALPDEGQTSFKVRMQKCRELFSAWLTKEAEKNCNQLAARLSAYDANIKPTLEKEQSMVDFRNSLTTALAEAVEWKKAASISHPAFELPQELSGRLEAATEKLNFLKAGLDACDSAIADMSKAKDLEQFKAGLTKLGESELTFVSDIATARISVPVQPTIDDVIAPLVFPDDPTAWTACKSGGEAMDLNPKNLLPRENAAYDKLLNDPNSDKIYQANITGKPNRLIYTANKGLSVSSSGAGFTFYSGKIFDPQFDGNVVNFINRSLSSTSYDDHEKATDAKDIRLTSFSTIYAAMSPRTFMMDNGEIVHSVWEMLDRATGAGAKSPAYMAYVLQRIDDIIAVRPYAWGLHFSPGARALLASFKGLGGGDRVLSGAWMLREKSDALDKKVGGLFIKPTSFQKEAVFNRALTTATQVIGMEFVGYVGVDGQPVLANRISPPESLFGLNGSIEEHQPSRIFEKQADGYKPLGKPIPFTPLIRFAGDRKASLKNALKVSGLDETTAPVPPPLFSGLLPPQSP